MRALKHRHEKCIENNEGYDDDERAVNQRRRDELESNRIAECRLKRAPILQRQALPMAEAGKLRQRFVHIGKCTSGNRERVGAVLKPEGCLRAREWNLRKTSIHLRNAAMV